MFQRLTRPAEPVEIYFEGRCLEARAGDSVAAALLAAGVVALRDIRAGEEITHDYGCADW